MSVAPERIWAEPYDATRNYVGRWTAQPRFPDLPTQYIRADLYYDLETMCDNWLDSLGLANIELKDQANRIADLEDQIRKMEKSK
jgi:hypothetical protein